MLSSSPIARGAARCVAVCVGAATPLAAPARRAACPSSSTRWPLQGSAPRVPATSALVCARRGGSSVARSARAKAAATARVAQRGPRHVRARAAATAAAAAAPPSMTNPLLETADSAADAVEDEELEELDVDGIMAAAAAGDLAAVAADSGFDEYGEGAAALVQDAAGGLASTDQETRLDGVDGGGEAGGDGGADSGAVTKRGRRQRLRKAEDAAEGDAPDAEHAEAPRADEEEAGAAADKAISHLLNVSFPGLAAEYAAAGKAANAVPVEEVRADSAAVAVWHCAACGHTWQCAVFVRCILKTGCPQCAVANVRTLGTARPELLQMWDSDRNDPFIRPAETLADSALTVFWRCPVCRDSFAARVRDRVRELARCPTCQLLRSQSVDALSSEEGAVLQEWHPLKNGDLRVDQVSPTDFKTRVWWLCSGCGHEWQASLASRVSHLRSTRGRLCPACHGKGVKEFI